MNRQDVIDAVRGELLPLYQRERRRLRTIRKWYGAEHPDPFVPRTASLEMRRLAELAKTPWLGLVVNVISQTMYVDGYRSPNERANSALWNVWNANKLDARQVAIHKAALAYGYAFATVLPGDVAPVIRGVSPLNMQALYGDPAEDDWPVMALRVIRDQPNGRMMLRFYDEAEVHYLDCDNAGSGVHWISKDEHGAGVCPVVRYSNQLDLEGIATGEVEPFIPIAARINKTDYDRLLTQHFASWKVRYVTGMAEPETDAEKNAAKMRLRHDDILIAEDPDSQFGTLDASPLDGFLKAKADDVETLAAVSQTPTNALTGQMINMSADALAAARAQLEQKTAERKTSFGESHAQALRLGAHYLGNAEAAGDFESRVHWADTSIRSMATAVDALGKAATMLQVPVQALWSLIPGVSPADVDEWIAKANQADPMQQLSAKLMQQSNAALSGADSGGTGQAA